MTKTMSYLLATLLFNTAIAGLLTLLRPALGWQVNFIFTQCIGFSIAFCDLAILRLMVQGKRQMLAIGLSLPFSVALGVSLGTALTGHGGWDDPLTKQAMLIGLFFGLIGIIALLLAERLAAEARARELLRSESERRALEAHLKLLQAQIEPHFLFNTLANVDSLIEGDPALARQLLARLSDWLRLALQRTRSEHASLGDELDLLENYLHILQIRFGERLRWQFAVPESARARAFPPMLLQPLVENAVRHGIEPQLGGGEIRIESHETPGGWQIVVSDSGVGLPAQPREGAGLVNIRARLSSLFGANADLSLQGAPGQGTTATLNLPALESTP